MSTANGLLMMCLVVCCLLLHAFPSLNGGGWSCAAATTNSTSTTSGNVRDWLNSLKKEASALELTVSQLEKVIAVLSKANFTSLSIRQTQLSKVKRAYATLSEEIQIFNSTCNAFDGPDCNIVKSSCDVKCSVCSSAGQCSVCSGNWDGATCSTCKSGWTGSNCDVQTLSSTNSIFTFGSGILKSCAEYKKQFNDSAVSGLYWIKPDATKSEFVVYCEQSANGGGWALVSSRNVQLAPYYVDIVNVTSDGASMRDDKWAMLRSASTEIMWKDATGTGFAVSLISVWTAPGICVPLSTKLTDLSLGHIENNGCDGTGLDYCLFGGGPLNQNSHVYNLCAGSTFKQWTFSGSYSVIPKANMYVR
ncbi:predicted protein [Naegleria gruberi]|uniref:Predicted protein n=1 Tax=Naegleria gruberi TaxID=5762 RepID=D2VSV0_NAEGR|nr:uncharacterized protein NAEGRDRAFT_72070 [Naegleria gruberi]EFC40044.1 predicted protein [Naegleria gruberi]|eukprot:XP_002672788.1 predicted protein [Naegleria gruberi strain NEG-M]